MNYGFASADERAPLALLQSDEPNRYSIQLYHAVVGDCDLRGRSVLEVGSGRGGGASFVARYHGPVALVGVDFSPAAVAFSTRVHREPNLTFRHGDAEALPFPEASFDAVLNVESSHCYGSMERFLAEVRRVLRPGGVFLHADLRESKMVNTWRDQLCRSGMVIERDIDIVHEVLRALDADNDRKHSLIGALVPRFLRGAFADFAGMKGTILYEGFRSGAFAYRCFRLRKGSDIAVGFGASSFLLRKWTD